MFTGEVFGWPAYKTWEFTSAQPIRSVYPLWLAYGFPLTILKWIWEGLGYGDVPPMVAFYTLRTLMFVLNFVLEDWAIHELLPLPRDRATAIVLVASSYVTWVFQTHTFSNSIETLLVLWFLILVRRIRDNKERTMVDCCCGLAFIAVLGVFNRITFPAFIAIPAIQLIPHLFVRRLRLPILASATLFFITIAITADTEFYTHTRPSIRNLWSTSVITPWNNLRYNLDTSNLAEHGLHPFWQHFVANLPQLIGPAFPLLFFPSVLRYSTPLLSGTLGIAILSCFEHQEPRFLLPAVPLLLSSIKIPHGFSRLWIGTWILFNVLAGILFGIYHQGGVVPTQIWLSEHSANVTNIRWWKTYSPPRLLLDGENERVSTTDLMGMPGPRLIDQILDTKIVRCEFDRDPIPTSDLTYLVAPASATYLDQYTHGAETRRLVGDVVLEEVWHYRKHIGLDDLDFGDDGFLPTLQRVVGRRGLVVWRVHRYCY